MSLFFVGKLRLPQEMPPVPDAATIEKALVALSKNAGAFKIVQILGHKDYADKLFKLVQRIDAPFLEAIAAGTVNSNASASSYLLDVLKVPGWFPVSKYLQILRDNTGVSTWDEIKVVAEIDLGLE